MEPRDRQRERLTCVAVAANQFTAELLHDQLREAGIPAMVRNRDGGGPIAGAFAGRFELFVLEGDADLASAVLSDGPPREALPPPRLTAVKNRGHTRRRRWWR